MVSLFRGIFQSSSSSSVPPSFGIVLNKTGKPLLRPHKEVLVQAWLVLGVPGGGVGVFVIDSVKEENHY